jgi:hypothetical protein
MKILSIDPGIKHLAFCLFEIQNSKIKIINWDIINISEEEIYLCQFIDNNISCNKPAKYKKNNTYFCLKHSKKQSHPIPTSEQKETYINKQKIQKLHEIANKYHIQYDSKIKKKDLLILMNEYFLLHFLQPISVTNSCDVNLFTIGLHIKNKFNKLFEKEIQIDYVLIENQISPIATRMKTIQGMIVQYFIMSTIIVQNIEFVSAANKLKIETNEDTSNHKKVPNYKTTYSDRKKIGVSKCLEIITNNTSFGEYINYFNQHKKKDDLSDSFLQGYWFIHNKNLL